MHKIKIKRVAKLLHSFSVNHDYISGVTTTERNEGRIVRETRGLK